MIGMIIGEVIEPGLVLAAGGVGYLVETPTTYQAGTQVRLYTHAVYREDAAQLYGFETRDELAVFTELISISGVGPKIAMAMLRKLGVGGVKRVFRDRDEQALTD